MKDADGTNWHTLRVSEYDREALAVARRLVVRQMREQADADVWRAVVINLDRMIEDWDAADD